MNPTHPTTRRRFLHWTGGALALAAAAPAALAQSASWPDKPIVLVVPSAAGGGADFIARTFGNFLGKALPGKTIIVENRAGAGGIVGSMAVKSAAPDGYTYLIATNSTHSANVSLYRNLQYDPQKDFEQVGMFGIFGSVLVVRRDSPYQNVRQLVDYAKANPGKLNYGYYSSSSQVPPELLKARAQLKYVGASYKNVTQILTDLLGGQIDFAFIDTLSASPALQNERLRPIAITTAEPMPSMAQLPTVASSISGFQVEGWFGLSAPAGTPKDIVDKMARLVEQSTADPATRQALGERGLAVRSMSTGDFRRFIGRDTERWAEWVKIAGIEPQ